MADKPTRPHFSLLTLLVAVNVAGVLVWANLGLSRPRLVGKDVELSNPAGIPDATFSYVWGTFRGWPLHFQLVDLEQVYPTKHQRYVATGHSSPYRMPTDGRDEIPWKELEWAQWQVGRGTWWIHFAMPFAVDLLVAIGSIVVAVLGVEALVRRSRRTTYLPHPPPLDQ